MSRLITVLRAGLTDEHATVYLFSVLGSRVSPGSLANTLGASFQAHRDARDALIERLAALGDSAPPGAAPAYDLPDGLGTDPGVRAAALAVEQRAMAGYGQQVAATRGADRTRAIGWLGATAVRQLAYGGSPSELPGL